MKVYLAYSQSSDEYKIRGFDDVEVKQHATDRGVLHNTNGAALQIRDRKTQKLLLCLYCSKGYLHHPTLPAYLKDDGVHRLRKFYTQGQLSNYQAESAVRLTHLQTGVHVIEENYIWGRLHSDEGPTVTHRSENGNTILLLWYNRGERHRLDGPAEIHFDHETGRPIRRVFWQYGEMHRSDGAAVELFDLDTNSWKPSEYWLDGKKVSAAALSDNHPQDYSL